MSAAEQVPAPELPALRCSREECELGAQAMEHHSGKLPVIGLVVGDRGAGKSTLLHAWQHRRFAGTVPRVSPMVRAPPDLLAAAGAKFVLMDTEGADPAVAEPAHTAQRAALYKRAHAIVIVFDATSDASFERVLCYWLRELRAFGVPKHKPVFVVGAKCDLQKRQPSARFGETMTSLMATMNEEHPQSFVVMSSAARWPTVLQLFMRVQVACLYPVALLISTEGLGANPLPAA